MNALPSPEEFVDIIIIGADKELTQRDPVHSMMYSVFLTLSAEPPEDWPAFFYAAWRSEFTSRSRRASVTGQHILIYCPLEELKTDHMERLKQSVLTANAEYKIRLSQVRLLHDRKDATEQAERERKDKELDSLEF